MGKGRNRGKEQERKKLRKEHDIENGLSILG